MSYIKTKEICYVDANKVLSKLTLTIKLIGMKRAMIRGYIGVWLIKLAGHIMCPDIKIEADL